MSVQSAGPGPRVTRENLGAWVLKGNADQTDLITRFRRAPRVDRWCVRPGYRARLMAPGQPVVFWAGGSRHRDITYGIWGVGRLAGAARTDPDGWWVPLDLTIDEPDRWLHRSTMRAHPELAA